MNDVAGNGIAFVVSCVVKSKFPNFDESKDKRNSTMSSWLLVSGQPSCLRIKAVLRLRSFPDVYPHNGLTAPLDKMTRSNKSILVLFKQW